MSTCDTLSVCSVASKAEETTAPQPLQSGMNAFLKALAKVEMTASEDERSGGGAAAAEEAEEDENVAPPPQPFGAALQPTKPPQLLTSPPAVAPTPRRGPATLRAPTVGSLAD